LTVLHTATMLMRSLPIVMPLVQNHSTGKKLQYSHWSWYWDCLAALIIWSYMIHCIFCW